MTGPGRSSVGVLLVLALGARPAAAQHSHDHGAHAPSSAAFSAKLALLAATYSTPLYAGDYQGVIPTLGWADERFGVAASLPLYRLERNSFVHQGLGDVAVHGQAALVLGPVLQAGVALAVSAPTGSQREGLGMGHAMVMPAAWASWRSEPVTLTASAGYSRALGGETGHAHGPAPLVDPMNRAELTWSVGAELAMSPSLRAGGTLGGGIALDDEGVHRVIAGARLAWTKERIDVGADLLAGVAGDPFDVRGILSAAVRF